MAGLVLTILMILLCCVSLSTEEAHNPKPYKPPLKKHQYFSLSFPLSSHSLSRSHPSNKLLSNSLVSSPPSSLTSYRSSFKYSMALIVSLPIGTPPQTQQMVLDTGSQLSWIQCHNRTPTTSFDPSLSTSFSILPCNHPACKPRIPDYTLPTSCDPNRLCHYSYFYADGTLAEGNLVREKFTFSSSQSTPPLILGCTHQGSAEAETEGILGMNLGRLSFTSQAKVSKFSYCVPTRQNRAQIKPTGTFYLGRNPYSQTFKFVDILTFPQSQRMPNLDPLAYTLGMSGIRIRDKQLNISVSMFRSDSGGSGQTIIDSGTEYTYLVQAAYTRVREEVVRLVGSKMKKGYTYQGTLDMCFNGNPLTIGRLIGDMVFEFDKGVEVIIEKERVLDDVGGGVSCVGIGPSDSLGIPSNIIGNFHQQNLWVEFDIMNKRVGFGKADCSRSV